MASSGDYTAWDMHAWYYNIPEMPKSAYSSRVTLREELWYKPEIFVRFIFLMSSQEIIWNESRQNGVVFFFLNWIKMVAAAAEQIM